MKKILAVIGILLVVIIITVVLFLGHIIKVVVEKAGPQVTGVPVTVEKVRVYPLGGSVRIKGLVLGNPEGFKTPSAMELGDFIVDVKMTSLLSDTIIIKKILIEAPQITYERALKSSNLGTLQKNMQSETPDEPKPGKEAEEKPKDKKAPSKKVIIEDFQLNNAQVNVSITALGGKKATLPLPNIQMQDIGKDSGGAEIQEVISETFTAITDAVMKAVSSSGEFAENALKDTGSSIKGIGEDASDKVKDAAGSIKKGIGGLFGKK